MFSFLFFKLSKKFKKYISVLLIWSHIFSVLHPNLAVAFEEEHFKSGYSFKIDETNVDGSSAISLSLANPEKQILGSATFKRLNEAQDIKFDGSGFFKGIKSDEASNITASLESVGSFSFDAFGKFHLALTSGKDPVWIESSSAISVALSEERRSLLGLLSPTIHLESASGGIEHLWMHPITEGFIKGKLFVNNFHTEEGRTYNQGHLTALSQDNLVLSGTGILENKSLIEARTINASMFWLLNSGSIEGHDLTINSGGGLANSGSIGMMGKSNITVPYILNGTFFPDVCPAFLKKSQIKTPTLYSMGGLCIEAEGVHNDGGILSGNSKTKITARRGLTNKEGFIGDPESKTCLTLGAFNEKENPGFGLLQGERVTFNAIERILNLGTGDCRASQIEITAQNLNSKLHFITPHLFLDVADLQLSNQGLCERTTVLRGPSQDFVLTAPHGTRGSFEIVQKGLSPEETQSILDQKIAVVRDGGDAPASSHRLSFLANFSAEGGLNVFAPNAHLHIGSEADNIRPEMLFLDNNFNAHVNSFELETGSLVALNAMIWAPKSIVTGKLIRDSVREVFSTFFSHSQSSGSHNLQGDIANVRYHFLGSVLRDCYDGYHLLTLPMVTRNSSLIKTKETAHLKGPWQHYGTLESNTIFLDLLKDSECVTSSIKSFSDLTFQSSKSLFLKRNIGDVVFDYYTYGGCRILSGPNAKYSYVISDPATVQVGGSLLSDSSLSIVSEGSQLHSYHKDPKIIIQSKDLTSYLFQKIMTLSPLEKQNLRNHYSRFAPVTRPSNSIAWHNAGPIAISFLVATNNFAGAQKVFPSNTSFNTPVILDGSSEIGGNFAAPVIDIRVGDKGLNLGSQNIYRVEPKSPIQDLMRKPMDTFSVTMVDHIKDEVNKTIEPKFRWIFQDRYFFDEDQSQRFYQDIKDYLVVLSPENGLRAAGEGAVFSLSAPLLVERIQEQCQDVLNRGYIYDGQKIDESYARTLHKNAHEFVTRHRLSGNELSRALVSSSSSGSIVADKPMIYYKSIVNDQGIEELQPTFYIPESIIERARGKDGGLIVTQKLLITDQGTCPQDILDALPMGIAEKKRALAFLNQSSSSSNAVLVSPVKSSSLAVKRLQQQLIEKNNVPTPKKPIVLRGEIRTDDAVIATANPIHNHARIEAKKSVLFATLDQLLNQSTVDRVYKDQHNFSDHIPMRAIIAANDLINIYTLGGMINQGADTQSGAGTHIRTLAGFCDIPHALMAQQLHEYFGKKSYSSYRRTDVHQSVSRHISGGQFMVESGAGIHLGGTQVQAKNIALLAENTVEGSDVHHTTEIQESSQKKGGGFLGRSSKSSHSHSISQTSQGVQLQAEENVVVASKTSNIGFTGPSIKARKALFEAPQGTVALSAGQNVSVSSSSSSSSNMAWNRAQQKSDHHVIYTNPVIEGELEIRARETIVSFAQGQIPAFVERLKTDGIPVIERYLTEHHESHSNSISGPSTALITLVALCTSIGTMGAGTGLAASMLSVAKTHVLAVSLGAGMSALWSQAAVSLVASQGNPEAALQQLASPETLKTIGMSMITAGLLNEAAIKLGVPTSFNADSAFLDRLQYNLLKSSIDGVVHMAIAGQGFEDTIKGALIATTAGTVGGYGASKIGAAYDDSTIGYGIHKVAHGLLGGAIGALISDDRQAGLIAGAMGAMVSEIVAEEMGRAAEESAGRILRDAEASGVQLSPGEFREALDKEFNTCVNMGKLSAALTAFLSDQDVNVSIYAATNALENNFELSAQKIIDQLTLGYESLLAQAHEPIGSDRYQRITKIVNDGAHLYKEGQDDFAGRHPILGAIGQGISDVEGFGGRTLPTTNEEALGFAISSLAQLGAGRAAVGGFRRKNLDKTPTKTFGSRKTGDGNFNDGLRLRAQLSLQDKGILDARGKLTPQAIKSSEFVKLAEPIGNPQVIKTLTKDGSRIQDWEKFKTQSVQLSHEQRIQIHFYKNDVTGKVDYETADFKISSDLNWFAKKRK